MRGTYHKNIFSRQVNFEKNVQLFDTELVYPTYSGFPLKLSSIGTAAIKVDFKTGFDLPAIVKDPKNTDIKFKFIPRYLLSIKQDLCVDISFSAPLLKSLVSSMSTSTLPLPV
jgi:hypothetical protein